MYESRLYSRGRMLKSGYQQLLSAKIKASIFMQNEVYISVYRQSAVNENILTRENIKIHCYRPNKKSVQQNQPLNVIIVLIHLFLTKYLSIYLSIVHNTFSFLHIMVVFTQQAVTQDQFLKRSLTGLNSEFSFH